MKTAFTKITYLLGLAATLYLNTLLAYADNFVEQAKLLGSDSVTNDFFGYSVALSKDTAVIGALRVDDEKGKDVGAAYVFIRSNNTWIQQAKLMAADGEAEDTFGGKVVLSGDTAVVGVMRDDDNVTGKDSGSAYIFKRTGSHWNQQAKLTASDASTGDSFGYSIGLSDNTLVLGAPFDDDKGKNSGSVYVFTRTGHTWTQQAKITAEDGSEGDVFGISIAISDDTILVGADLNEEKGFNAGAAYVFTRSGGNWTQQTKLTANDGAEGDLFGVRVALEENTALISARRDDDNIMGVDSGSAYIFTRVGNTWGQQVKLKAPDGAKDDRFGRSVALSGDNALIGAMFQDEQGENSGSAYLFKRSGRIWNFKAQLMPKDGSKGDVFGWNVALLDNTALISANRDNDKGENSGSAYIFDLKETQ
ncbi:MAG: hypothetical protein ACI9LM_003178 [Alteromonadaceae bacterium]|jgi:hypothetical protein